METEHLENIELAHDHAELSRSALTNRLTPTYNEQRPVYGAPAGAPLNLGMLALADNTTASLWAVCYWFERYGGTEKAPRRHVWLRRTPDGLECLGSRSTGLGHVECVQWLRHNWDEMQAIIEQSPLMELPLESLAGVVAEHEKVWGISITEPLWIDREAAAAMKSDRTIRNWAKKKLIRSRVACDGRKEYRKSDIQKRLGLSVAA